MPQPKNKDIFVLKDDGLEGSSFLFSNPHAIIHCSDPQNVESAFLSLQKGLNEGYWAAGFFSYELGYCLENKLADKHSKASTLPLMWFGLFKEPERLVADDVTAFLSKQGSYKTLHPPKARLSAVDYQKRFQTAQEMIAAGDIYQLNLTFKSDFKMTGDPLALYKDLREIQPVHHGAFVKTPDFSLLSLSPELFLKKDSTLIKSRPMKGTEPRGNTPENDKTARERLKNDAKQRAENLMIVDLMRNDIGRIAQIGSVHVPHLFSIETYPTLHQMTSDVSGELKSDVSLFDTMKALFPAGSITGAPKIRAMELIADIEDEPRGAYCGSIGAIAPHGDFDFNVAIRTATLWPDGRGEFGIGSGVVADSVSEKEYQEALLKMQFLSDVMVDFELFETMLFEKNKGIWLLDEHMARLSKSANRLRFAYDEKKARALLIDKTADYTHENLRVRLVLERTGDLSVTTASLPFSLDKSQPDPVSYLISPSRLASDDLFLQHKTTRREIYDREFTEYNKSHGVGEVIYLNERDELCEGSRTNIFLKRGGVLRTPALRSGLLPGTLRDSLLTEGKAVEAILTLEDLHDADTVYLGNSVRGLQPGILKTR